MTANLDALLPKRAEHAQSAHGTKAQVAAGKKGSDRFGNILEKARQTNLRDSDADPDARETNVAVIDNRGAHLDIDFEVSARIDSVADALAPDETEPKTANAASVADPLVGFDVANEFQPTASPIAPQISNVSVSPQIPEKARSRTESGMPGQPDGDGFSSRSVERRQTTIRPADTANQVSQQPIEPSVVEKAASTLLAPMKRGSVSTQEKLRVATLRLDQSTTRSKNGKESTQGLPSGARAIADLLPNIRKVDHLTSGSPAIAPTRSDQAPLPTTLQSMPPLSRTANLENVGKAQPLVDATSKVVVLSQESHLPTVSVPLVIQQVGQRVEQGLKELSSTETDMAPTFRSVQSVKPTGAGTVVRTMTIQLNPRDLGLVTVQMSLNQSLIQLDLEVADHTVARVLGQNRDALASLLHGSGYVVEDIVVRPADVSRAIENTMSQDRSGSEGSLNDEGSREERNSETGDGSFREDKRDFHYNSARNMHDDTEVSNEGNPDRDIYL